jgi:hypothetical protein
MDSREALKNTPATPDRRSLAPPLLHDTCQTHPDLAAVVEAWPGLLGAIRAGILAMVKVAAGR